VRPSEPLAQTQHNEGTAKPPIKKVRHRQWSGAILGLLIGIVGLAAGRLGQLYPHFDVFSQFGMQFVAMAVGFSVALFMARYKALIGVVLTVSAVVAYGAWPHLVSARLQQGPFMVSDGEVLLKVAHFNSYKNNAKYQVIADEVLRLDADVVTLVEVDSAKKKGLLPLLRARYPHIYDCAGIDFCNMAIVSKYPITSAGGSGVWEGAPHLYVALGGKMKGITIFGVHMTRFPYSNAQIAQARALAKTLDETSGRLIVLGDFNATPFSRVTRTIEQGAALMRVTELPTWPTTVHLPQLAIDHAFVSKDFRVAGNQQIGEAAGSDHYPILLTLAFKPTP
jgi:endonuclease/exonuclease/phosphatase (EEP) superfamily protein YafD